MALVNVSLSIAPGALDVFDTTAVNVEGTLHVELITFMVILIPVVNIPIIRSIYRDKAKTFINILVLLHCVNALGHVPMLLEFYQ